MIGPTIIPLVLTSTIYQIHSLLDSALFSNILKRSAISRPLSVPLRHLQLQIPSFYQSAAGNYSSPFGCHDARNCRRHCAETS